MKGTKRLSEFKSNFEPNDSIFQSKKVVFGPPFDVQRVDSSFQQPATTFPLDPQRAASSQQHVRALNTQFASWVQSQLQNHPDELWEDGVQDYLSHASDIKEKFSDVVSWLKANAVNGEALSGFGSQTAEKKLAPETKKNEIKLFQNDSGLASTVTAPSFHSWSSTPLSGAQNPFIFGNQSSVPQNHDAGDDVDGEDEDEQPSSPSVKKVEEEGIVVVHEVKCKLYVKSINPEDKETWKDKGTGQLSIKCKEGVAKGTKESKPTIIVRNDVGRLLLNALLYTGIKTSLQKNSIVAILHTSDDMGGKEGSNNGGSVMARTFLIRTKTEEDRNKLAAAIKEYAPVD
ncbi:Ran binding domain [Dillenia turbinata]|uniref:Ran binding domain n=1 Tax=Dillenia turbinata TaxID=194707 RepID=A0AAN8WKA6_9MAGN